MRWTWYRPAIKELFKTLYSANQCRAVVEWPGLFGRPGANLTLSCSTGKVRVCFVVFDGLDASLDAHLSQHALPMEEGCNPRITEQGFPLAALVVRIKDEASLIVVFKENHSQRWRTIWVDGGNGHGVWVIRLVSFGQLEPIREE